MRRHTRETRRAHAQRGARRGVLALALLGSILAAACGGDAPADAPSRTGDSIGAKAPVDDASTRIVFLGNSLTAGFGLDEAQAFPALVGAELTARGHRVRIVNAGVSGDTTAGGLARLDWILRGSPDLLVIALGANDGLRGLSVEMTEENLSSIIRRARERGAYPLLLGMRLPPNMGPDYVTSFEAVYPRLAAELEVPLVPFLLEGVAAVPDLNLPDGIHPNAAGQRRVAGTVLPLLEQTLAELEGGDYSGAVSGADSPDPDLSATLSNSKSTDS